MQHTVDQAGGRRQRISGPGQASKRFFRILMASSMLVTAPSALAQEAQDYEAMIRSLERQLQELKDRIAEDEQKIDELEITTENAMTEAENAMVEAKKPAALSEDDREEITKEVIEAASTGLNIPTNGFRMGDTTVSYGGYVKLDVFASNNSGSQLASDASPTRDFYIPTSITLGDDSAADYVLDFNVRESRFIFKTATSFGKTELSSHIELDFLSNPEGNEAVVNGSGARIRNAFLKYGTKDVNVLVGQFWSTFFDVSVLPENLDFIGPAESTIFVRQPQVRVTFGNFEIAAENPDSIIRSATTIGGTESARFVADGGTGVERFPDIIGRYTFNAGPATIKVAGLFRELRAEAESDVPRLVGSDSAYGFAGTASAKIRIGERDDLRLMFSGGNLGRYMGVAVYDGATVDADGNLDTLVSYGGFASLRHFWTPKWRSNLTFGYSQSENPTEFTTDITTRELYSVHANLLYSPVPKLTIGLEGLFADRELDSGLDGTLSRIIMSARYTF